MKAAIDLIAIGDLYGPLTTGMYGSCARGWRVIDSNILAHADHLKDYHECQRTITELYPDIPHTPTGSSGQGPLDRATQILKDRTSPIVHVYGKPGSGKSDLCRELAAKFKLRSAIVLEFRFCQWDGRRRTSADILLSFVRQVLCQVPSVFQKITVRAIYNQIRDSAAWTRADLQVLLRAVVSTLERSTSCVFIIDDIDECDETATELLAGMVSLAGQVRCHCSCIVTSSLAKTLKELHPGDPTAISLDFHAELRSESVQQLQRRKESDFRDLAECLVCGISVTMEEAKSLLDKEAFGDIERPLRTAYTSFSFPFALLSWLIFAVRPLTINELSVALAVDTPCGLSAMQKRIRTNLEQDVRQMLGSLVTIEGTEIHIRYRPIRESLVEQINKYGSNFADVNARIAKCCLLYLSSRDVNWDKVLELATIPPLLRHQCGDSPDSEFLLYASRHWATHLRNTRTPEALTPEVLKFLKNKDTRHRWYDVYWALKAPLKSLEPSSPRSPSQHSPLDISAHLGLHHVFKAILGERGVASTDLKTHWACLAAEEGHLQLVSELPKSTWENDYPLGPLVLSAACKYGRTNIVEYILGLRSGFPLQQGLSEAVTRGYSTIVDLLLECGGVDTRERGGNGDTLLIIAARRGYETIVQTLVRYDGGKQVNTKNNRGFTALDEAARNGHSPVVRFLADIFYEGNKEKSYHQKQQQLEQNRHDAYERRVDDKFLGHPGIGEVRQQGPAPVAAREAAQGDVEGAEKNANTAVGPENEEVENPAVSQTTQHEDEDDLDFGLTPLHLAVKYGHDEVVKDLLNLSVEVNVKAGVWKFTPLHFAAFHGHPRIVSFLLAALASWEEQDNEGFTPLALACMEGHLETAKSLIRSTVINNKVSGRDNRTALHFAAENGHFQIVEALLDRNADTNVKCILSGETPLHLAMQNEPGARLRIVRLLVEKSDELDVKEGDSSRS